MEVNVGDESKKKVFLLYFLSRFLNTNLDDAMIEI